MNQYVCPVCGKRFKRELVVFLDHAQVHMIDVIKKKHPEWVSDDGLCKPCVEHYKKSLRK